MKSFILFVFAQSTSFLQLMGYFFFMKTMPAIVDIDLRGKFLPTPNELFYNLIPISK